MAASLSVTTADRVKALKGVTGDVLDAAIAQLILSVSQEFELYLGRHMAVAERTETIELRQFRRRARLKGFPITDVASIKWNYRTTEWDDVDELIEGEDYELNAQQGTVLLLFEQAHKPGFLRVTYTGGMAADSGTFVTGFPDIAGAADAEIIERIARRDHPGVHTPRGKVSAKSFPTQLGMLNRTKAILSGYRRVRI